MWDLPQQKALAILPKFSALCSLLGSLYVVGDVGRMPASMRRLYHRLMLGMSLLDCLSSGAFFLTTWPIPPDVWDIYGAVGTPATCTAQGFLVQLSISTVLYNGSLACYYYLVIRRGWTDRQLLNSRVEYWLHSVPIVFGMGTASASAALGLYNPNGWNCWIAAVPVGCHGKTCIRGDHNHWYQWSFFLIPLWMTMFLVTAIMFKIFLYFYRQEKQNDRWDPVIEASKEHDPCTSGQFSANGSAAGSVRSVMKKHSSRSVMSGVASVMSGSMGSVVGRKKVNRAHEIRGQATWFIGSMFIVWIFPTVRRILERIDDDLVHYQWVFLSAIFWPSQGWFNFLVYMRPRYLKVLKERRRRRAMAAALMRDVEVINLDALDDNDSKEADEPKFSMAKVHQTAQTNTATFTENDLEELGMEREPFKGEQYQPVTDRDASSKDAEEEASARSEIDESQQRADAKNLDNTQNSLPPLADDSDHSVDLSMDNSGNAPQQESAQQKDGCHVSEGSPSLLPQADIETPLSPARPSRRSKAREFGRSSRYEGRDNKISQFRRSQTTSGRFGAPQQETTDAVVPLRRSQTSGADGYLPSDNRTSVTNVNNNIRTPRASRGRRLQPSETRTSGGPGLRRTQTNEERSQSQLTPMPLRRTSTSESPNHIRRMSRDDESDEIAASEAEGSGRRRHFIPHIPDFFGGKHGASSNLDSSRPGWNPLARPKPTAGENRGSTEPTDPTGMSHSMGNASHILSRLRHPRVVSRDAGPQARLHNHHPREGDSKRASLSKSKSSFIRTDTHWKGSPRLGGEGQRPGLSKAKSMGGAGFRGNLTRGHSVGGGLGLTSDGSSRISEGNGKTRRTSGGVAALPAWMTITGVREFAEDIAAIMKAGDGGLGATWAGNLARPDHGGGGEDDDDDDDHIGSGRRMSELEMNSIADSLESRDFNT